MKYIYIICLTLSSLFTYKNGYAEELSKKYAFFIPNNSFQQNTAVEDIDTMRPRYSEKKQQPQKPRPTPPQELPEEEMSEPQISLPYVKKIPVITEDNTKLISTIHPQKPQKPREPQKEPPRERASRPPLPQPPMHHPHPPHPKEMPVIINIETTEHQPIYQEVTQPSAPTIVKITSTADFRQKTIPEMLQTIPYPNPALPKFKQCYELYGMDLRVLYRRGAFPSNEEQEKTLAKANSLARFEVK